MKTMLRRLGLLLGLGGLLAAGAVVARGQEQTGTPGPSAGESSSAAEAATATNEPPRYVQLLNTSQVIALNGEARYRFLYGMSLTGGFDDGIVPSAQRTRVPYTLWNPHVGLIARKPRGEFLSQDAPTVGYFNDPAVGRLVGHQGEILARGDISQRWSWDFRLGSRYGSFAASLLSPYHFSAVGSFSAVNPHTLLLGTTADRLDSDATLGLHWRVSVRDQIYFSVGHDYTNSFGTGLPGSKIHVNRSNFTLGLQHAISRRWALTAAANGIHHYHYVATASCTHYGALFGVAVHPSSRTDLSVSVGPELGDTGCVQSRLVTYQGFGTVHLTRHWSTYVAAERSTSAPIFLPTAPAGFSRDQLTHTAAAGVMRDAIGGHLEMRLDGGYISTEGGTRIRLFNSQGKFIAPQVGWRLTRTLGASATYRRIYQLNTGINQNRNQFFVTLDWRPDAPEKSGQIH